MIIFNAVALLYLVSGLWCTFQAERSMTFLGYAQVSDQLADSQAAAHTLSEFITVYGGLQIGIGLAMLLANVLPQYYGGTLFFATVFSVVLIAMRVISLIAFGFFSQGNMMAVLELIIAASLVVVFVRYHFATS